MSLLSAWSISLDSTFNVKFLSEKNFSYFVKTLGSTLKKKLTENSASLTGCNRLTCQGDGKLFRHEDRVNPTSSDDEDGIFLNHRNFPMVFCSPAKEFSDNFPSTFRRMNHQKWHQQDSIPRPSGLQSTTLPLRHSPFMWILVMALSFTFLSTCRQSYYEIKQCYSLRVRCMHS
jgi:hypothetical protein